MTALKAMTIWPAWQHFEEDRKGSLEVGKLADFVILSVDPTSVDPETLDKLRVMATIEEDEVIYEAEDGVQKGELVRPDFAFSPAMADQFLHAMYNGLNPHN